MALIKKNQKKDIVKLQDSEIEKILKFPHISEKATDLIKNNHYIFRVSEKATKNEIKKAIENFYGVEVLSVRTIKIPQKKRGFRQIVGRKSGFKKAIVKLKEGQKIEILPH